MRLDDITAHIRLRTPWEATDLGFALVQHNWRSIFPAWTLLLFTLSLLLWLVFPAEYTGYIPLVLWWLKPAYDRVLLHIYSRQMFSLPLSLPDIVSALPTLLRHTGLLGALTLRRFSLSRGFNLPIWQLEQLRGKARTERQGLLHRQSHSYAVWLTIACSLIEGVMLLSLYAVIIVLDPTERVWDYLVSAFVGDFDTDVHYWGGLVYTLLYTVSVWLLEPFYIAASFSLYLNRRTQLEAWDIELTFRSLGERLRGVAQQAFSIALAILLAFTLLPSAPSYADDAVETEYLASETLPAKNAREQIDAVMQLDAFSQVRTVSYWQPKKNNDDEPENPFAISKYLQVLFANVTKALLWVAVVILLLLGFVYRQKILAMLKPLQQKTVLQPPPDVLFGMDIRPESLPDDIGLTSRRLWDAGQQREALSLLYRAALMRLTRHDHLQVHDSHTEGDILSMARPQLGGQRFAWLTAVTRAWQEIAYAHRIPPNERVYPLFDDWANWSAPR
jgi:hypothetical protein